MTINTKYSCNLCDRELAAGRSLTNSTYPEGWALTWCGPGVDRPMFGATLEEKRLWQESPIHLCQVCVRAVQRFADKNQELRPDTPAIPSGLPPYVEEYPCGCVGTKGNRCPIHSCP
jgi:hypothetical protein